MLAKKDIFGQFSAGALVEFANAFRTALAAYGDWDGKAETLDVAISSVMDGLWNKPEFTAELKSLIALAADLENKQNPLRPITVEESFKIKAFCDAYLGKSAQREMYKLAKQSHIGMPASPHES